MHNLCLSEGTGVNNRGKLYSGVCAGLGSGYKEQEISHCDIIKCGVGYDGEGNEVLPTEHWKCINTEFEAIDNYAHCVDPNNPEMAY